MGQFSVTIYGATGSVLNDIQHPSGKEMLHTRRNYSDPARNALVWKARNYRALKSDCTGCELKAKCCPNAERRSVHREKYEVVRDFARVCTASEFNPKAQARRKKVEMLFAHLKRILGLGRLRLRGPCGVQDEFTSPPPPKTSGNWPNLRQW